MKYISILFILILCANCSGYSRESEWSNMSYGNEYASFVCNSGAPKLNPGAC
jgi:hypothetical protein